MTARLSLATLADWAQGRLDQGRDDEIERAIAEDPETAEAASWVVDLLDVAGRLPLETPPPELGDRLRALFDRPSPDADEDPSST